MSEGVLIALIAGAVTIVGVVVGTIAAEFVRLRLRVTHLEHRDRLNWIYIRRLIDHSYRHHATPLPEPPEGWDDTE
jgi:ABC-type branched-subunit amino acid transport system permease subunit